MPYRFDDFTLNPETRQLLRSDAEARLSPKAFELLLQLVANHTRALSKAELHRALWPSTFVQDTNLASLVAEIRRALGDSADDPRYLRTMHRFGYWFIGPVSIADGRSKTPKPSLRCWVMWEKRQIALSDGDNLLGRAPEAVIWLDAPGISRHHARIRVEGSVTTLEDLGSKNGTYLGGQRVTAPVPLADGDQIRLGSVVITFRVPPPGALTETVRA